MELRHALHLGGRVLHVVSLYALGAAALAAAVATAGAAAGVLPWLTLEAGWGGAPLPRAGMVAQVGLLLLLCALLAFFPASGRVLALERSHRQFRVGMQDVANAYHAAHVADRAGAFTLASEFDAVRERLLYLRDHPDLKLLEADVLTLAAQMSRQSHGLAVTYADAKVARARAFLAERQAEAEDQGRRVADALLACGEVRRWAGRVEVEEAGVDDRLRQLEDELRLALGPLGYRLEGGPAAAPAATDAGSPREDNVVTHPSIVAAE